METKTETGQVYYCNMQTGETAWSPPGGGRGGGGGGPPPPPGDPEAVEQELSELQAARRELTHNTRRLKCTIYVTGTKPEKLTRTENPKMGSVEEIVNDLLEVRGVDGPRTQSTTATAQPQHSR